MSRIRILLVDDNREFLRSAANFLSAHADLEIVGLAVSGKEALRKTSEMNPDLVLMDVAMPEMNGIEATRLIKNQPKAPRVVVLTLHNNAEYRSAARAAGADGLLSKQELPVKLIPLIHTLFKEAS